jgi:cystathionine beta-lyase
MRVIRLEKTAENFVRGNLAEKKCRKILSQKIRRGWRKMKYDFDKPTNRRGMDSLKWDVAPGEIPLWVADMDFETAPFIREAILNRAEKGIFGYSVIPERWAESYVNWWKKNHDFEMQRDWLIFSTGVVPSISSCVRKLTTPAEKILVQTPCYNIFFNSIVNNGRRVLESPMKFDEKNSVYSVDFERLEKDLSDEQVSLMILCNPQNPSGNIWSRPELEKIGALCKKYGVLVLSDEIHCDIVRPGKKYVPFASVSDVCREISVSLVSPTKCFNIAGLNTSCAVVPDENLRHKIFRALNTDEIAEPSSFAVDACVSAFENGAEYLHQLNEYLFENRRIAEEFMAKNLAEFSAVKSDATYLFWLNVKRNGDEFARNLRKKTGLFISGGGAYGKTGENFVRINLACRKFLLDDALTRLEKFVREEKS